MCFFRHHDAGSEEETVEGHRFYTETGASDESYVLVTADARVCCEDGLMEVFKGVATSRTATGPLKNDSEVGIGRSDIDNLTNASTEPGLKATWRIPTDLRPSMISAAFSVVGIPAATQNPSIGKPSRRISAKVAAGTETGVD